MTLVRRALLAVVVAITGLAVVPVAAAQPLGVDVVTTGGVSQSVMSINGRFVAWTGIGSGPTLYVRDRIAATTKTYTNLGAVLQYVFAISDDGRYLASQDGYRGRMRTRTDDGPTWRREWCEVCTTGPESWPGQPLPVGVQGVGMSRDGRTVAWAEARFDSSGQVLADVMAVTPLRSEPIRVGGTCLLPGSLYVRMVPDTCGHRRRAANSLCSGVDDAGGACVLRYRHRLARVLPGSAPEWLPLRRALRDCSQ